jgi:hypothetical protein
MVEEQKLILFSRLRFEVYSSDLAQALLQLGLDIERRAGMAIEIKGLKAKALAARANLDKLSQAYDKFNEMAPAHAADVEGLASQITSMQTDLEFASTLMGNSAGESESIEYAKPGPHPSYPTVLKTGT